MSDQKDKIPHIVENLFRPDAEKSAPVSRLDIRLTGFAFDGEAKEAADMIQQKAPEYGVLIVNIDFGYNYLADKNNSNQLQPHKRNNKLITVKSGMSDSLDMPHKVKLGTELGAKLHSDVSIEHHNVHVLVKKEKLSATKTKKQFKQLITETLQTYKEKYDEVVEITGANRYRSGTVEFTNKPGMR